MARLTPDAILKLSEPIEKVYSNIVDALLVNIARHLREGNSLSTAQWEVQKIAEMGKLTEESARIIAGLTGQNPELIMQALEGAVTDALVDVEPELKKGVSVGTITAPESSTALASNSIRQALEAYDEQAIDKLNLVNTTMLESTLEQYRKIVTNTVGIERQMQQAQGVLNTAAGEVITGVSTRQTALRKALDQMHKEGITGFYDRAGRAWSPEAYVNMEIRTTVHNTAVETIKLRQEDYGVEIFRVSRHSGARPLCYPYQGRYFSWDNSSGTFTDGEGKRHRYQGINTTSYGKPAGLFGISCGHHPITVIPGVSIPRERAEENKEENDEAYALSQKQRALERDIRYAKQREAMYKAAGDEEGVRMSREQIKRAQANMRDFIGQTGRTRRRDREQIYAN
nr:MAG TPA: minor capsid protein [Caudoviricetes sp.]